MEENLITIDLKKHIVIPVNEPFEKEDLIELLAQYWKYYDGEEKIVRKTFDGNLDDFAKEIEGKEYAIITTTEKGEIIFDVKEKVPFEESRTEWVISKYLKPSTDALLAILLELQTKDEEEKQKAYMEAKKS